VENYARKMWIAVGVAIGASYVRQFNRPRKGKTYVCLGRKKRRVERRGTFRTKRTSGDELKTMDREKKGRQSRIKSSVDGTVAH